MSLYSGPRTQVHSSRAYNTEQLQLRLYSRGVPGLSTSCVTFQKLVDPSGLSFLICAAALIISSKQHHRILNENSLINCLSVYNSLNGSLGERIASGGCYLRWLVQGKPLSEGMIEQRPDDLNERTMRPPGLFASHWHYSQGTPVSLIAG